MKVTQTGHIIEHEIGDVVYLKTDEEPIKRIVVSIHLKPHGAVAYVLAQGMNESHHWGIEITNTPCI